MCPLNNIPSAQIVPKSLLATAKKSEPRYEKTIGGDLCLMVNVLVVQA